MIADVKMGKLPEGLTESTKTITFCVTEECNLRCKYCYMIGKNSFHRMNIETAKRAVDFFLSQPYTEEAVVWDFIGGEPTLEIDLIEQIVEYIQLQTFKLKHPWFTKYTISVGSNGLLYDSPQVQKFIMRHRSHLSFSITIDGNKEKHDLQRVRPDGSGSYDTVAQNVKLWLKQFPNAITKVTFASDDLPMLKDSIKAPVPRSGTGSVEPPCPERSDAETY